MVTAIQHIPCMHAGYQHDGLRPSCVDCVVCMEGQRCMVLVPCGHVLMCQQCCAAHVQQRGKLVMRWWPVEGLCSSIRLDGFALSNAAPCRGFSPAAPKYARVTVIAHFPPAAACSAPCAAPPLMWRSPSTCEPRASAAGSHTWLVCRPGSTTMAVRHMGHCMQQQVGSGPWLSSARLHAWRLPQRAAGRATAGTAPSQAGKEGTTKRWQPDGNHGNQMLETHSAQVGAADERLPQANALLSAKHLCLIAQKPCTVPPT